MHSLETMKRLNDEAAVMEAKRTAELLSRLNKVPDVWVRKVLAYLQTPKG